MKVNKKNVALGIKIQSINFLLQVTCKEHLLKASSGDISVQSLDSSILY